MIKRVDELKYTKQIIAEKLEERNTQKRRVLIRLVDALIVVSEDKEQLSNIVAYNTIEKRELNIDIILEELKDTLSKLNKVKNIYNYLNNMTLQRLAFIFGDLIQFMIHANLKSNKKRMDECEEEISYRESEEIELLTINDIDNNCVKICRLIDKQTGLFIKQIRLQDDMHILRDAMREISDWHPLHGLTLRGLNIQWVE